MKRAPRRFKRRRNRLFRTERGSGLPFGRSGPPFFLYTARKRNAQNRMHAAKNKKIRTPRQPAQGSDFSVVANDPNCDTNEPPLSLGGSLCAKGVHPPMSNELQI